MDLTLTNFRCHREFSLSLPESGLVLLHGPSGIGKSTILNAVLYALYGTVQRPQSFGQTKCKVELSYKNLKAVRTTRPNRLVVGESEDLAAQEIINEKLSDVAEFNAGCYIRQKSVCWLLTLPPGEKVGFVHHLALNGEYYKRIKVGLKQLIAQKKDIFTRSQALVPILPVRPEPVNPPRYDPDSFFQLLKKKQDQLRQVTLRYFAAIDAEKQANEYIELEKRYFEMQKSESARIARIRREMATLGSVEDLEKEQTVLKKKIQQKRRYDEYVSKKRSYDERIILVEESLTKISGMPMPDVESVKHELLQATRKERLVKFLSTHPPLEDLKEKERKLLENSAIPVDCPKCKTRVFFAEGTLLRKAKKTDTKGDINIIRQTIRSVEDMTKELNGISTTQDSKTLTSKLVSMEKDITEIQNATRQLKSKKYDDNLLLYLEPFVKVAVDPVDGDPSAELANVHEKLVKTRHLADQISPSREFLKLEKEFKQKTPPETDEEDIQALRTFIDKTTARVEKLQEMQPQIEEYRKYQEQMQKYRKEKKKWKLAKKAQDDASAQYEASIFLKEKFAEAESLAVGHTLTMINSRLNAFLEHLFDEPITVQFVNFKKTAKTVKPRIDIRILYRGNEYNSIDQLSGGEYDRVSLACLVALSTMYRSPIIMLDECISSLDEELANRALEALKEFAKEKLILVVNHQANTGIFDKVVDLYQE